MNYHYKLSEHLVSDVDDVNKFCDIRLCVYSVNSHGKYPFLTYLLTNTGFRDGFEFPILPIYQALTREKLLDYSLVYLSGLAVIENFENFKNSTSFDGFYEYDGKLYLFFNVTKANVLLNDIHSTSPQFILMDEIVNTSKFCHIPIHEETSSFFIQNSQFIYLYTDDDQQIEIPSVGFMGEPTEAKLKFSVVFGESTRTKSALMGPYYYFTNFRNAFRRGGWMENDIKNTKSLKGGLVRFALFAGTTKYIENNINDEEDRSDIKKERLEDNNLDRHKEALTIRISDHDGLWTNMYNSVYVSNKLELDDGSYLEDTPILVLKDYEQQVPLSYHFIDKTTLGDKYDPNDFNYRIM